MHAMLTLLMLVPTQMDAADFGRNLVAKDKRWVAAVNADQPFELLKGLVAVEFVQLPKETYCRVAATTHLQDAKHTPFCVFWHGFFSPPQNDGDRILVRCAIHTIETRENNDYKTSKFDRFSKAVPVRLYFEPTANIDSSGFKMYFDYEDQLEAPIKMLKLWPWDRGKGGEQAFRLEKIKFLTGKD